MATVCITFFLITQFYVCKMEADLEDRLKKISRREKRWSMNSQRLEEIVAELMKPISDVRRNFDTDLSALLEEYLTEAGLRALEAGEDESSDAEPNFAEIALLLQHSANIYSHKVDFLYQDVLRVTDSLNNTIIEEGEEGGAEAGGGGAAAGGAARRGGRRGLRAGPAGAQRGGVAGRRAAPAAHAAAHVHRAGAAPAGRRGRAAAGPGRRAHRPARRLPRRLEAAGWLRLHPHRTAPHRTAPHRAAKVTQLSQLCEISREELEFHLMDGFLVEELGGVVGGARGGGGGGGARALGELRPPGSPPPPPPLTLPQLSAPPPPPSPFLPPSPFNCSTPLPKPIKKERKRRIDVTLDIDDTAKLLICEADVLSELRRGELTEFSVPERWIRRVVQKRCGQVLSSRLLLRCRRRETEFLGWDTAGARDVGGFPGWAAAEARSGHSALTELRRVRLRADDSDDDGFFEQSSYSDGEPRHSPDRPPDRPPAAHTSSLAEEPEWYSWRERVLSRSAEATPDVQQTAALLLRALAAPPPAAPAPGPTHIDALLRRQHLAHGTHPAHLTLAALFLANSGNIEIVQGEPLTVNSFSIKLLSSDESLYRPAIARDHLS